MTKLEELPHYQLQLLTREARVVDRDEAIAAAREDIREAEGRAYRQGVEDMRMMTEDAWAGRYLLLAREYHAVSGRMNRCRSVAIEAKSVRERAFKGIRGIARVEIRQRLERIGKGNENG